MAGLQGEELRRTIRQRYGKLAAGEDDSGCGCGGGGCCTSASTADTDRAQAMGYSREDTASVPDGANLGLGCGNPGAFASLKPGETVLDLGCGAGFDCFLAAKAVGASGKVIGVDMTPEMIAKARENALKDGANRYLNVEFRLGEIEHLPVADQSVDIVISNCVLNLSGDKEQTLIEAFRVLRPGGRLAVSDVVAVGPLPERLKGDLDLVAGCIGGAESIARMEEFLQKAGFEDVSIIPMGGSDQITDQWLPETEISAFVRSATIEARKPLTGTVSKVAGRSIGQRLAGEAIQSQVHREFKSGLHCAEAVAKTILDIFDDKTDKAVVRSTAGLGGGIVGTTEETCGALTGGIIALGAFLGRNESGDSLQDLGRLGRNLREGFVAEFGSTHCGTLRTGFNEAGEPLGCVHLSARTAEMTAELIYDLEQEKNMDIASVGFLQRQRIALGRCPFSEG